MLSAPLMTGFLSLYGSMVQLLLSEEPASEPAAATICSLYDDLDEGRLMAQLELLGNLRPKEAESIHSFLKWFKVAPEHALLT